MATLESTAARSDAACDRIEKTLAELGVKTAPLPRLHKNHDMLRTLQLERIADALEAIEIPKPKRRSKQDAS